jgi:hypothetical protein
MFRLLSGVATELAVAVVGVYRLFSFHALASRQHQRRAVLLAPVIGINGFYWFQAAASGQQQWRSHSIGCRWRQNVRRD